MRIAICDDDDYTIETVNKYLYEFFKKNQYIAYEIVKFHNGEELLADKFEKDIIFLDVEMPGMNGIYVGKRIKEINPKSIIIIITSFSEYLDDAMRFCVFRYLSKPIDKNRLLRNMQDAVEAYLHRNVSICIESKGKCYRVDSDDIIMVEAQNRKTFLYTVKGDYELTGSFGDWCNKLAMPNFYICHRSYLVNLAYVYSIDADRVILKNGQYQAYLTRRKARDMKNKFLLFLENKR